MFGRTKVAMLTAEFLGAATITTVVLAVVNSKIGFPLFVASSAGLTYGLLLLIMAGTAFVHANPAVTVGLWSLKKIDTNSAIAFIAAQLLGGIAALRLFEYLTDDTLRQLIGAKTIDWRVFTAEVIGTVIFTLGLSSAIAQKVDGLQLAITASVALMLGMVVASTVSNAILNPAVALGVNSINYTYVVAPVVGSLIGMNLYKMLFAPVKSSAKKR